MDPRRRAPRRPRTLQGLLIATLLAIGLPATVSGQEPPQPRQPQQPIPLPELTVPGLLEQGYQVDRATTATKTDTPIFDTPASVQVVPRQVIEEQRVFQLKDVYRNVSGVQPEATGGFVANRETLFIRGFQNQFLYRDGFRTNPFTPFDPATSERVEVLKGPASVLYGLVEPGGIVNILSKRPLSEPYYRLEQDIGSFDFYRTAFDISGPITEDKRFLYRLNAAYTNTESFREFVDAERVIVAPVVTWRLTPDTTLTLEGSYAHEDRMWDDGVAFDVRGKPAIPISRYLNDPTFPGSRFEDIFAGYVLEHRFTERWRLRNAFQFHRATHDFEAARTFGPPDEDGNVPRIYDSDRFTTQEFQFILELHGDASLGPTDHKLLAGVDVLYREFLPRGLTRAFRSAAPPINIFNPVYGFTPVRTPKADSFFETRWVGLYVQDQVSMLPGKNLKLLAGGRVDYVEQKDGRRTLTARSSADQDDVAFTPRVGLLYQPIETLALYTSYSRSFFPTRPLFSHGVDNQPLDPEEGEQYEVGVKTEWFDKRLSTTLAVYQITKDNVPVEDPANPDFQVSGGKQRSRGIELDILGRVAEGWNVIASYAYTDTEVLKSDFLPKGARLRNIPLHAGSVWLTYDVPEGRLRGLGAGAGVFAASSKTGDDASTFELPAFFRADAAAWYTLPLGRARLRIQLNVQNVSNEKYYEASFDAGSVQPGAPRTFIGSIAVQF